MSTTRLQEVQICFGFGKQTDIATANLVAAMWRLKKLKAHPSAVPQRVLVNGQQLDTNFLVNSGSLTTVKLCWPTVARIRERWRVWSISCERPL